MSKTFKILSIDGGGIKGLYSALILQHLEEQFDCCISDYFDMLCGTSTGGLIALALSIKKPAADIVKLYQEQGSAIFPTYKNRFPLRWYGRLQQTIATSKYSNRTLKKLLTELLGNYTLGQANNLLCIPSFNLTKGQPRIFKFPHNEGKFTMDRNISMVDAALATSAAPTFFPIVEIDNGLFVDGGIWCNNPAICGLLEALDYFVGTGKEYSSYQILSLSSVTHATGWQAVSIKSRSFLLWGDKLFQASMDGQSYFTDFFVKKMCKLTDPTGSYYRIPSPNISHKQVKIIGMDRADKNAIKLLSHLGDTIGHEYRGKQEIIDFFQSPKTYRTV